MNHELQMPTLIQRIAIISSAKAAGYQDFCKEIYSSEYHFSLSLFDAYMQGAGAEESIIAALEAVATADDEFDIVVIIRGGGSSSDLQCFDSYRIASHIAQFPLPVITGIGHDKDVSIADMVAAQSLKTPTAVATMLTERMAKHDAWLEGATLMLHDATTAITHSHMLRLQQIATEIKVSAEQKIESEKGIIANASSSLPTHISQFITLQESKLEGMSTAVKLHSPANILRLGFAVARSQGAAIRSLNNISIGQSIDIEITDAHIVAEVKKIEKT